MLWVTHLHQSSVPSGQRIENYSENVLRKSWWVGANVELQWNDCHMPGSLFKCVTVIKWVVFMVSLATHHDSVLVSTTARCCTCWFHSYHDLYWISLLNLATLTKFNRNLLDNQKIMDSIYHCCIILVVLSIIEIQNRPERVHHQHSIHVLRVFIFD